MPSLKTYAVFTYDDVHTVLSGREFTAEHQFRSSRRAVGPSILDVEDPDHRRLRHLVHPPLGLSSVRANRPALRAVIERLLDGLPVDEPVDLMSAVAELLPMQVICHMLGLPASSARWLARTSQPLAAYLDETEKSLVVARACRDALIHYLDEHFFAPPDNPAPLGSRILTAFRDGGLSLREAQENLVMLLVVGTVTTVCGSGNTLACLLSRPEQYARLVDGELSAHDAVAESLRYEPPVHFVPRFCRDDTELAGIPLPRGTAVNVCLASANRDPAMFGSPDDWLPGRTDLQRTFVFGYGRHGCVGGLLGEAEIVELVDAMARRFPGARLHGPPPTSAGWVFRRPETLMVVLEKEAP
ncbi:cytochrome P450 [Streptomyces sp. BK205]|uniref:cytochrome P450 n=1 Tax=Streptomyces sp. BK205 TaxID=2512164 RepID=UPI00104616AB|nr:cytochrome P450 [Streptomyces sp. BK205]